MRKIVFACISLLLAVALTACGGSDKKSDTSAGSTSTVIKEKTVTAPPSTTSTDTSSSSSTPDTSGSDTPGVSTEQKAETKAAAACLQMFSKKIKGSQQYGKPAILGYLKSGNVVALVMYGSKGGARVGERQISKAHPTFDAYHSPNDKILIFFGRKAKEGTTDFTAGNTCQKVASAAG